MSGPWWTGLAPVTRTVTCGEAEHRLEWHDGALHASDHPQAERELALIALGADPQPCLEILASWRAHADDLDVLVLGSRGPGDRFDQPGWPDDGRAYSSRVVMGPNARRVRSRGMRVARSSAGWTGYAPMSSAMFAMGDPEPSQPEALLRLGGLGVRLTATVIAAWSDRIEAGRNVAAAMPRLHAALYGRVRVAVRDWLGDDTLEPEVRMLAPGQTPSLTVADGRISVAVPFSWLRDVWVRGFATVLGRLVLAAEVDAPGHWHLLTVGSDLGAAQPLTISAE